MPIETDPLLLADALWKALERARNAFARDPDILWKLIPQAADGLNATTINKLAKAAKLGPVFTIDASIEGGRVVERRVIVFHPDSFRADGPVDPVRWITWRQIGFLGFPPDDIKRTLAYLSDWQRLRAEDVGQGPKPRRWAGPKRLTPEKTLRYREYAREWKDRPIDSKTNRPISEKIFCADRRISIQTLRKALAWVKKNERLVKG